MGRTIQFVGVKSAAYAAQGADTKASRLVSEARVSTVVYAIGTIAAAAFGAILYTVITGDSIVSALTNIINRALNTNV